MLDRTAIARLIPHAGAMCLLEGVRAWSGDAIEAWSRTHLAPDQPLRRGGMLPLLAGGEYAFQAAALHGALRAGGRPQPPGRLASLRLVPRGDARFGDARLDDPRLGTLTVAATLDAAGVSGLIYRFRIDPEEGPPLLEGRFTIALPGP